MFSLFTCYFFTIHLFKILQKTIHPKQQNLSVEYYEKLCEADFVVMSTIAMFFSIKPLKPFSCTAHPTTITCQQYLLDVCILSDRMSEIRFNSLYLLDRIFLIRSAINQMSNIRHPKHVRSDVGFSTSNTCILILYRHI